MQTVSPTIVLFGATGHLAITKLFPALADLVTDGFLEAGTRIIAVGRRPWDAEAFRNFLRERNTAVAESFLKRLEYVRVDVEHNAGYERLGEALAGTTTGDILFYLSLAPNLVTAVVDGLHEHELLTEGGAKLLIEKPFGTDGASARRQADHLTSFLSQGQLYPVDHYLGKTTLQALMRIHEEDSALRRSISNETVGHVAVELFEQKGIEGRGASYDGVGALRDVGQNHMLLMLAVLLAEYPKGTVSEGAWQDARALVLEALCVPKDARLRKGQYGGYREETGVMPDSQTETAFDITATFCEGELTGVPLTLRAGKALHTAHARMILTFRDVPGIPREMIFEIQPEARIITREHDGTERIVKLPVEREAYANIMLDALRAERRHFPETREILAAWRLTDALLVQMKKVPLESYSKSKPFFTS